jgi:hypothetical protein
MGDPSLLTVPSTGGRALIWDEHDDDTQQGNFARVTARYSGVMDSLDGPALD